MHHLLPLQLILSNLQGAYSNNALLPLRLSCISLIVDLWHVANVPCEVTEIGYIVTFYQLYLYLSSQSHLVISIVLDCCVYRQKQLLI